MIKGQAVRVAVEEMRMYGQFDPQNNNGRIKKGLGRGEMACVISQYSRVCERGRP